MRSVLCAGFFRVTYRTFPCEVAEVCFDGSDIHSYRMIFHVIHSFTHFKISSTSSTLVVMKIDYDRHELYINLHGKGFSRLTAILDLCVADS